MIIRFTKGNGKPDTLTCIRDDGSSTYAASAVGTQHDLLHYAVETTLGYEGAFLGIVAKGRDIDSFGTKSGVADRYPEEALQVEVIVSLLQWPALSGAPLSEAEFFEQLAAVCAANGLRVPEVTTEQLAAIRATIDTLFRLWEQVPPNAEMKLRFP